MNDAPLRRRGLFRDVVSMRSRSRVVRAGGSRKRHARVAARVAPGSRGGGRWARASSPRASSPPRERLRPVAVENGNAAVSGPSDAHVRGAIDAIDAIDAWCFRASPRSRDDARREDARREIENDPSGLGCRSSAGWDVPPRARGGRREPSSGPWRRICCYARSRGGGRRGQSRGRARVRGRYPGGSPIATRAALAHRSLQISRTNAFASGKRSRGRDRGRTRRPRRGRRAGERQRR